MKEIIYFEVNNWFCGRDYPNTEKWKSWMNMKEDPWFQFRNEEWLKDNQLVVVETFIDMSVNFCVTAKKEWVESNCPELLEEPWSKFLRINTKGHEFPVGRFGTQFFSWSEKNVGWHIQDDEMYSKEVKFIGFLENLQEKIEKTQFVDNEEKQEILKFIENQELEWW